MGWAFETLLAFMAAVSFGILFNVPRNTLISCGIVGTSGWFIHRLYVATLEDPIQATFVGAFIVTLAAHLLARRYRMPMIVFSVSGIIMLVPGGRAFNAMRHVVENDYLTAIAFASEAFMISGAIAMGLVFAEVFMQIVFKAKNSRRKRREPSL